MIADHDVLAVIIGRAGSKGLPGKNSRLVAGHPIVSYSIRAADNSSHVDHVLVSTDCHDMADAARELGTQVIDRPSDLASDTATVDAAVRHAVTASEVEAQIVVILYANVPLRPGDLIDRAISTLASTGADSVQSYAPVGKHHPYWMSRIDESGRVMPFSEHRIYRRQDLPPLFLPDGGVIAVTRESLFTVVPDEPHAFLGDDRRGIINPEGSVIDIDCAADLHAVESLLATTDAGGIIA